MVLTSHHSVLLNGERRMKVLHGYYLFWSTTGKCVIGKGNTPLTTSQLQGTDKNIWSSLTQPRWYLGIIPYDIYIYEIIGHLGSLENQESCDVTSTKGLQQPLILIRVINKGFFGKERTILHRKPGSLCSYGYGHRHIWALNHMRLGVTLGRQVNEDRTLWYANDKATNSYTF